MMKKRFGQHKIVRSPGELPKFSDGETVDLSVNNSTLFQGVATIPARVGGRCQQVPRDDLHNNATIGQNMRVILDRLSENGVRRLYITGQTPKRIVALVCSIIGDAWKGEWNFVGPRRNVSRFGRIHMAQRV